MNETYMIIMALLGAYTTIQIVTGALSDKSTDMRAYSTLWVMGMTIAMLPFSVIFPIGKDIVEYSDAKNVRVGDEFMIQSEYPTQIINNIKFENKEVRVKKTQQQNAWGGDMDIIYEVEIIK